MDGRFYCCASNMLWLSGAFISSSLFVNFLICICLYVCLSATILLKTLGMNSHKVFVTDSTGDKEQLIGFFG